MKIVQQSYDYIKQVKIFQPSYNLVKKIWPKISIPHLAIGFAFVFLTVAVVQQTARLSQLERRSSETEIILSKRSGPSNTLSHLGGAIYTRWGRMSCPVRSKLIYSGIVGGQLYSQSGGGSNILCLSKSPNWGNYTDKSEGSAYIYGGEYEISHYTASNPVGLFSNAKSQVLHNHNVPCAVCQIISPGTTMMLPGQKTCPPGWNLEYFGYLMTSHYGHTGRSEYLCIDGAPEADPSGYRDENGVLFYMVQGACGSLPCPPYVNGRELTCAVCSQMFRPRNN